MAMRPRITGGTNPTGRQRPVVRPVYEDIKPMSEWIQDQESDILLIHLPGFTKENLKVSTEGRNIIRARGEHLVAGNKLQRFQEDYQVPDHCNLRGTRARFEGGILTITVPKKSSTVSQSGPKDEAKPTQEQSSNIPPQKPATSIDEKKQTSPQKDEAKAVGEAPGKKGQDDIPPKPSSTIIGDKGKDQTYSEAPATQKMLNEEKPAKIVGEKQTDKKNSEASASKGALIEQKTQKGQDQGQKDNESSQFMGSELVQQATERSEINEAKGKPIVEKSKLGKDRAGFGHEEKAEYVEPKAKQATDASTSGTGHFRLENFKQSVKSLAERDEERQLLMNVGVAVLVIVALGAYVYNTIRD